MKNVHLRDTILYTVLAALTVALIVMICVSAVSRKEEIVIPQPTEITEERHTEEILTKAELLACQYDYDAAIDVLNGIEDEKEAETIARMIDQYESEKAKLVEFPIDQVTHVFFHTLLSDYERAFDGDYRSDGYNQVMTTVDEFNKIIRQMYEKGYVMVDIHDLAGYEEDEDGNPVWKEKKIMLPPDKKAFILSQDDVCYYEYMEDDGFPSNLCIDENGEITNKYIKKDGSVTYGAYDVVPLIEAFLKEHPDFSYHGARGLLALTGYNGVLGYRTDDEYKDTLGEEEWQKQIDEAKKVAEKLKSLGWGFASHSWGHINMQTCAYDNLVADSDKWDERVKTIIGDCDVFIFPFGSDVGNWKPYDASNEKYQYLKNKGFRYFCNVDASTRAWVQNNDGYLRQGRRNLDGYRIYYDMIDDNVDYLSDLFDVKEVFDKKRPVPVPEMK